MAMLTSPVSLTTTNNIWIQIGNIISVSQPSQRDVEAFLHAMDRFGNEALEASCMLNTCSKEEVLVKTCYDKSLYFGG